MGVETEASGQRGLVLADEILFCFTELETLKCCFGVEGPQASDSGVTDAVWGPPAAPPPCVLHLHQATSIFPNCLNPEVIFIMTELLHFVPSRDFILKFPVNC